MNEHICIIDPNTRTISVPSEYQNFGVESDEKVTRVKFQCPRIVGDNLDLSECNVYVNYRNAIGEGNVYLVDDVTVFGDDITFSWLLSRHVTEGSGNVNYIVCAKKSDGTNTTNEWNTKVAKSVVNKGLEVTQEVEEQNADVIEQILARLDSFGDGIEIDNKTIVKDTDGTLKTAVGGYEEIQQDVTLYENSALVLSNDGGIFLAMTDEPFEIITGQEYKVTYNGTEFTKIATEYQDDYMTAAVIGSIDFSDSDFPIAIVYGNDGGEIATQIGVMSDSTDDTITVSLKVVGDSVTVHKIPEKFVETDSLVEGIINAQSTANTAKTTASNAQSTASNAQSTAETAQSTANTAKTTAETAMSAMAVSSLEMTIEWDGDTTGKTSFTTNSDTFYKVSDTIIPFEKFVGTVDGYHFAETKISPIKITEDCYRNGNNVVVAAKAGTYNDTRILGSFEVEEPGIYFKKNSEYTYTELLKIKVPAQDFYYNGILINSSTPSSNKKFKITVDDTGTLSATEVT